MKIWWKRFLLLGFVMLGFVMLVAKIVYATEITYYFHKLSGNLNLTLSSPTGGNESIESGFVIGYNAIANFTMTPFSDNTKVDNFSVCGWWNSTGQSGWWVKVYELNPDDSINQTLNETCQARISWNTAPTLTCVNGTINSTISSGHKLMIELWTISGVNAHNKIFYYNSSNYNSSMEIDTDSTFYINLITKNLTQSLNTTPKLEFNVIGTSNNYNCSLYVDNSLEANNDNVSNNTNSILIPTTNLSNGEHDWYIECKNSFNITNTSQIYSIGIGANFSRCAVLVDSGVQYNLTADILNSGISYCINIPSPTQNTTLDCLGHRIDGDDSADYGIYIYRSTQQTTNITIKNCIVSDWATANVYLYRANGNTFENVVANSSPDYGFYLYSSNSNSIVNSTANNNYCGFRLGFSDSNSIVNSSADSNSEGFYFEASNSNSIANSTAGSNSNDGFFLYSSTSNSIVNSSADSNSNGFRFYTSNSNSIMNSTANYNGHDGFYFWYSNSNSIANSTIASNSQYGIYLYYAGQNGANLIYNNLFNNTNNFYFDGTIYANNWNTSKQNGTRIYSYGTEIGGNFWAKPDGTGYSEICNDTDGDLFCDNPYTLETNNVDYLPYFLDDIPPSLTIDQPIEGQAYSGIIQLLTTISDINSGVKIANFTITNSTGDVVHSGNLTAPDYDSSWNSSNYSDGEYIFKVEVWDNADNYNTSNVTFIISSGPPSLVFINPKNLTYHTENITSNFYYTDDVGLSYCKYNITNSTGGIKQQNSSICNGQSFTFEDNLDFDVWKDNNYTIMLWANDTANNIATKSIIVIVDNTPPILQNDSVFPTSGYVSTDTTNLDMDVEEPYIETGYPRIEINIPNIGRLNYTMEHLVGNTYRKEYVAPIQGEYSFRGYVKDKAGNLNYLDFSDIYVANPQTGGGGGGGGISIKTECGNYICEYGENKENCPIDCGEVNFTIIPPYLRIFVLPNTPYQFIFTITNENDYDIKVNIRIEQYEKDNLYKYINISANEILVPAGSKDLPGVAEVKGKIIFPQSFLGVSERALIIFESKASRRSVVIEIVNTDYFLKRYFPFLLLGGVIGIVGVVSLVITKKRK